jgi:hypothetical protein
MLHQQMDGGFARGTEVIDHNAHVGGVCVVFLLRIAVCGLAVGGVERCSPAMDTIEMLDNFSVLIRLVVIFLECRRFVDMFI